MSDFNSYADALTHRVDVLTLDVISDSLILEDYFLKKLVDAEEGLYVPGSLHPVFYRKRRYYRARDINFTPGPGAKNFKIENAKHIDDLNTLKKEFDDIYDDHMSLVIDRNKLSRVAKFLTNKPSVPVVPVRLAIGAISKKISQSSKNHVPTPVSFDPINLVRPEFLKDFDQDDECIAFPYLMDKVTNFIGDDMWNIYSVDVKGTAVVITKGLDWRILEYYRMKFEKENKDQG